jgi:predicted ribosomally synthesized peptide with nif11-like leader
MASDAELKATIMTEYRAMLCAIARREGFDVTVEELRTALLQEQGSLTDEELDRVSGGMMNTAFGGGLGLE